MVVQEKQELEPITRGNYTKELFAKKKDKKKKKVTGLLITM
jgi:hypothetical protein